MPLLCLMLLLFCRATAVSARVGQGFQLHQPQGKVSVAAGETLNLNCTTSGSTAPGPMRWLKGWGSGNKTIYDQRETDLNPRVTRAVAGSATDFTIHIRNVQPEDMGTYYCVQFTKSLDGADEVFRRGSGTEVSVHAKPTPPLVSGPEQRAGPGQSVPFTCTTGGFFPEKIGVKWFKNRDPMVAQPLQVTEWKGKSYNMSSTVMVTLQKDDVRSQLTCEVQHSTLVSPLRGTYPLSRALRVSPSVEVHTEPCPVEVNKTVTFTCLVKEFYPANLSVSWLESGTEIKVENTPRASELARGLFELRSQVEVQAMEEKNGSTVTCMVVHDAQTPINYSAFLWISKLTQGGQNEWSHMNKGTLDGMAGWGGVSARVAVWCHPLRKVKVPGKAPCGGVGMPVPEPLSLTSSVSTAGANLPSSLLLLCLGILLEKGLLAGLLFFLFKRMEKKASGMLPYPTPSQSLAPPVGSQGLATASSAL